MSPAAAPLLVCWTPKGGSGASTIAAAAAWRSALEGPTLVVDLGRDQWNVLVSWPGAPPGQSHVAPIHVEQPQTLIDYAGWTVTDNLTLLHLVDAWPTENVDTVAEFLVAASDSHNVVVDAGRDDTGLAVRLEDRGAQRLAVMRCCTLCFAATATRWDFDQIVVIAEPGRVVTPDDIASSWPQVPVSEVPYSAAIALAVDRGFKNVGLPPDLEAFPLPAAFSQRSPHRSGADTEPAPSLSEGSSLTSLSDPGFELSV